MRRTIKQNAALTRPLLPSAKYWMLLVLTDGRELHGYEIKLEIKASTGGHLDLDPGSTYGYLKELKMSGLIDESEPRWSGADGLRRYYSLTDFGQRVLKEEQRRIRELARNSSEFGWVVRWKIFYRSFARRCLPALAEIEFLWLLILVFRSLFGTEKEPLKVGAPLTLQTIPIHFYLILASVVFVLGLTWRQARRATADELGFYSAILGRELPERKEESQSGEGVRGVSGITGGLS